MSIKHGKQLQLFMTGQELQNHITMSMDSLQRGELDPSGSPVTKNETMRQMWNRKTTESKAPVGSQVHGAGVHESIGALGYKGQTLMLGYGKRTVNGKTDEYTRVRNGHHRIAAAADIERTTGRQHFIPVEHDDPKYQDRFR